MSTRSWWSAGRTASDGTWRVTTSRPDAASSSTWAPATGALRTREPGVSLHKPTAIATMTRKITEATAPRRTIHATPSS